MPPNSRGAVLIHCLRRYTSTTSGPSASTRISRLPPSKPASKSSLTKPSETATSTPNPTQRSSCLRNPILSRYPRVRKTIFYIIVLTPIIGLLSLHKPLVIMHVTGESMYPFFNADHDPDSQLPSSTRTSVLVQRGKLFDINEGRKRARGQEVEIPRLKRGSIVVFPAPHAPQRMNVKRVVALPGDRVRPLPGYAGGDNAVIVPWNHVWVEGDAGSREKSSDSNVYGPMSQNLIFGEVTAILSPWYRPRWIESKGQTWPAKKDGRVEEDVVMEASVSPDAVARNEAWENGVNRSVLQRMKDDPDKLLHTFNGNRNMKKEVRDLYRSAVLVVAAGDPDSEKYELAQDMISLMDELYGQRTLMEGMVKRRPKGQEPAGHEGAKEGTMNSSADIDDDRRAAREAQKMLMQQGWEMERDKEGKIVSRLPSDM